MAFRFRKEGTRPKGLFSWFAVRGESQAARQQERIPAMENEGRLWEAAGRDDAAAGQPFRERFPLGANRAILDGYSRGFWREFDRLRFERGEYDLL